ncbi:MAG: LCP family protein [Candidatus Woesebacteria bacterium]
MKRRVQKARSVPKKIVPIKKSYTSRVEHPRGADRFLHFFLITFLKVLSYLFVFLLGGAIALILALFLMSALYLRVVSTNSGIAVPTLLQVVTQGKNTSLPQTDGHTNILVLGTDALANRDEQSKLTDTIMVLSVNSAQGKIDTFSIPRDLWIASQSAKINGLYEKGQEPLIRSVVGDITGLTIHRVIVMDIATVGKLIDAFGGLDVNVERSFVDYKFPRSDVDVRVERDPAKLYETIAFTKGIEHMSGDRALRFIRSRHSLDLVEGTDDARVKRQQRVIEALLSKIKDPLIIRNPEQLGHILEIYRTDIESGLPLQEASGLGWSFLQRGQFPKLVPHQFTTREGDKNGVFTHPDRFPGGVWVYLPVDPTYTQIRTQVAGWIQN